MSRRAARKGYQVREEIVRCYKYPGNARMRYGG